MESGFKEEDNQTQSPVDHSDQMDPSGTDTRPESERVPAVKRHKGIDPLLLGALLTALFIVALALGFMLARVVD